MDYYYNYHFLQEFMTSRRLAKRDLLEALETNDYTSLNKWLEGKVPVHVTAMLRLCNYYNIPLSNFFCDKDGLPHEFNVSYPDKNAQLSPTDGYGIKEGMGRGIVETHINTRSVTSKEQEKAVNEGLVRQAEQRNRQNAALAEIESQDNDNNIKLSMTNDYSTIVENLQFKLEHSEKMRNYESNQLMKKIDSLQQEISKLKSQTSV